jgi:hypothetical protein
VLDTANPSDLLLIEIMAGLRHRYESLNRQYEEQLINDFRFSALSKSLERIFIPMRPTLSGFFSLGWQRLWDPVRSAPRQAR